MSIINMSIEFHVWTYCNAIHNQTNEKEHIECLLLNEQGLFYIHISLYTFSNEIIMSSIMRSVMLFIIIRMYIVYSVFCWSGGAFNIEFLPENWEIHWMAMHHTHKHTRLHLWMRPIRLHRYDVDCDQFRISVDVWTVVPFRINVHPVETRFDE